MAREAITEQVIERLAQFFRDEMPSLREVYEEFPDPNERLRMPSASLFTVSTQYENADPQEIELPVPDSNNEYYIRWAIGRWVIGIQVDLWGANKKERNEVFEEVFDRLNLRVTPPGLDLVLPKYYDRIAHYHVTNYEINDGEEASQVRERRARIDIIADVDAVVERKEFAMTEVTVNDGEGVDITDEPIN